MNEKKGYSVTITKDSFVMREHRYYKLEFLKVEKIRFSHYYPKQNISIRMYSSIVTK